MKTAELRRLSDQELAAELVSARDEIFNMRFQLATRQLKDYRGLARTRRKIGTILTLQRERQLERELGEGAANA